MCSTAVTEHQRDRTMGIKKALRRMGKRLRRLLCCLGQEAESPAVGHLECQATVQQEKDRLSLSILDDENELRGVHTLLEGMGNCDHALKDDDERGLPWLPGDWDERCTLKEPLGCGAFGGVYRARYAQWDAALKVQESENRSLAVWEAKMLLTLDGAGGAPRLLGVACCPPVLIMEYRGSWTLEMALWSMTDLEILASVVGVGRAIAEIHQLGVVHNDIKPNNILVFGGEAQICVSLIDFGIASLVGTPSHLFQDKEEEGEVKPWMSPELVAGDPVTVLSDSYGFGFVCLEAASFAHSLELKSALEDAASRLRHLSPSLRTDSEDEAEYLASLAAEEHLLGVSSEGNAGW